MTHSVGFHSDREVIAILPAGGQGTRISPLPMSKELFPIGFRIEGDRHPPKVVGHYLLEKLRQAGIRKAFVVLRPGKWDIPAYFGDGKIVDMQLAYLTVPVPYGVPYTLNQASPFVKGAIVALGFPDILFQPEDAFISLLRRQAQTQADIVLGLFPTDRPQKSGMVDVDDQGLVHHIIEKPTQTNWKWMWAIAVWSPVFTQFMQNYLQDHEHQILANAGKFKELPIGDVMQAAIHAGLRVEAEIFETGSCLDIGTPEDLATAIQRFGSLPQAIPSDSACP